MPQDPQTHDWRQYTDEQLASNLTPEEVQRVQVWRVEQQQYVEELGRLTQQATGLPQTGYNLAGDPIYTPAPRLPTTPEEHTAMFKQPGGDTGQARKAELFAEQQTRTAKAKESLQSRLPLALGAGLTTLATTKNLPAAGIEAAGAFAFPPRTPGELTMQAVAGPYGQAGGKIARTLQRGGTARRAMGGAATGMAEAGLYATGEQAIDVATGRREGLNVPVAALALGGGAGTIGGGLSGIGARQGTFIQVQNAYKKAGLDVPKTPMELQSWERKRRQRIPDELTPGAPQRRKIGQLQLEEKTLTRRAKEAEEAAAKSYNNLTREKGQLAVKQAVESAKLDQELTIIIERVEHVKTQQKRFLAGQKTTKFDVDAANKDYARRKVDFTVGERFANIAGDQHLKGIAADSKEASGAISMIRADLAEKLADTARDANLKIQDKETATRLINEWTQKRVNADNLLIERAGEALGAEQKRLATMPKEAREQLERERDIQAFGEVVADSEVDIQELRVAQAEIKTRAADVTLQHKERAHVLDIQMAKAKAYDSNTQAEFASHLARIREELAGARYRDNPRIAQMLSGTHHDVLDSMRETPAAIFGEYVETLHPRDQKVVQDAVFERMFSDVFTDNKPWQDSHAKIEFLLGTEKADIVTDIIEGAAQTFKKSWVNQLTGRVIHHTPTLLLFHPKIFTQPALVASAGALFVATTWNRLVGRALDNPKVGRALADWLKNGATVTGLRASHHLMDLFKDTAVPVSPERAGATVYFNLAQNARLAATQRPPTQPSPAAPQSPAQ